MKQLKNGRGLTDSQMGFLLIVPGLAVFLAIILYPFVDAVITSFTDRSLIYPDYKFVAFANYAKVFKDPYFGKTLIRPEVAMPPTSPSCSMSMVFAPCRPALMAAATPATTAPRTSTSTLADTGSFFAGSS